MENTRNIYREARKYSSVVLQWLMIPNNMVSEGDLTILYITFSYLVRIFKQ